jgi:hypothetical protein
MEVNSGIVCLSLAGTLHRRPLDAGVEKVLASLLWEKRPPIVLVLAYRRLETWRIPISLSLLSTRRQSSFLLHMSWFNDYWPEQDRKYLRAV